MTFFDYNGFEAPTRHGSGITILLGGKDKLVKK